MKYVVDTHALIWFLEGNLRLGSTARTILSDADNQLILPAITLAEAVWIMERGKTSISSTIALLNAIDTDLRIVIYPLDRAVIQQNIRLVEINEMHDRQIMATALVLQNQGEEVALLSCDQNISASGLITVIW